MKLKKLLFIFIIFKAIDINSQTWYEINSPTNSSIYSCSFLNENLGWVVTSNSIHKTTDGGTTWINQSFPAAPNHNFRFFNSIHFINENIGIIACGNYLYSGHDPNLVSTILWTNDGGQNWVYKDLGSENDYDSSAILVTPLIAYSIGQYGQSKKTIDGGASWTACSFSSNTGYSGRSLFALNENNVYFAGLQNIFLTAAIGKMNGSTWFVNDLSGSTMMHRIFFIDNNIGWTVGNGGVIKITNNAGFNWVDGNSGVTSDIYSVSFKNNQEGWAVTSDGKILKSIDGGYNWTINYSGTSSINDITFKNLNNFGYAVGNNGKILKCDSNLHTEAFTTVNFSVYPNPTNDLINIKCSNIKSKISKIEIYNSIGQIVKNIENLNNDLFSFKKNNLNSGVYYIKIISDENMILTKKLILKD